MRTVKAKRIHPKPRRGSFQQLVCLLEELMAVSAVIVGAQADLNTKLDALDAKVSALVVLSPADAQAIADGMAASGAKVDAIAAKLP